MDKRLDTLSQIVLMASVVFSIVGIICQNAIATYFKVEPHDIFAFGLIGAVALIILCLIALSKNWKNN